MTAIQAIASIADTTLEQQLQQLLDQKTKPVGSLGRLEQLALQVGLILGTAQPQLRQPQMLVFAGDHGLARQGVSAFAQEVSKQMAVNILQGGAAISVLARQHGMALTLVDCGIAAELPPHPQLRSARVMPQGTQDCTQQPAMTLQQCLQAIEVGRETVRSLPGNAVLLGELGIGNTSPAALLLARLEGLPIEDCTGAGTGMRGAALEHKIRVLARALKQHAGVAEPLPVLAALGGLELAAMTGAVLQAAQECRVIVVDGFVTSASVLVAARLQPNVLQRCVFSHLSHERGHRLMLQALNAQPLLQMDLRLGEGSGAALAWPLLESACRILGEMASFESAGVSRHVVGDQPPS